MPKKFTNILKHNHEEKSMNVPFFIYESPSHWHPVFTRRNRFMLEQ